MSKEKAITLVWYAKTPRGWLRFPALLETQHGGRKAARQGWVIDRGVETHYPDGRYQLRTWENGKLVYNNVPGLMTHPRDAVLFLEKAQRLAKANANPAVKTGSGLLKNAAKAYVKHLEDSGKMESAELTRVALDEFQKHCETLYVRSIPHTPSCVTAFHKGMRTRGLSLRTISNKHALVKSFFKWQRIDTSFMPEPEKYELTLPTIYSPTEITSIREAAKNTGDEVLSLAIDMALMLGLREREIIFSMWSDIDWEHSVFRVQGKPQLGFKVKDSEQRDVPIPQELMTRLTERKSAHSDSVLILGTAKGKPVTHLLHRLKRLAIKTGLNCRQCNGCTARVAAKAEDKNTWAGCDRWQLHKFRRTYLTTVLRNGIDVSTAQRFAGHSDLASTMRYLRPAATREIQSKVNNIRWGA